jgi:hypothetical protein
MANLMQRIILQLKWLLMSQEKRYVYLWNRTNPKYRY